MTLQQLRYIIAIADAGSISRAAETLYVSQPSLSSALADLEAELGIELFFRGARGVTPTQEGSEFLLHARQLYAQYQDLEARYVDPATLRRKFGVTCQHYSFAVKAFVEMAKGFDTSRYDFAIREAKTLEVIQDVATTRSEVGVLYLSDFNRAAINRLLRSNGLEFHRLIDCAPYVYLWRGHPLAGRASIRFEELVDYPCLSFEQGEQGSFYLAEEILSAEDYARTVKVSDRATMLNLMIGLDGYTLCSGIICEELNGNDCVMVPFDQTSVGESGAMEIGYLTRRGAALSNVGQRYVEELERYLSARPA